MKDTSFLLIFSASLTIMCVPKDAIACQVRHPDGFDFIKCNDSLLKGEPDRPFILKVGQTARVYTKIYRGLVEGIELSLNDTDFRGRKEKIWDLSVRKFQEYPKSFNNTCRSNILISRSQDYTLNPVTRQDRRTGYRTFLGCGSGMSLELLDLTASGEAKIVLKRRNSD